MLFAISGPANAAGPETAGARVAVYAPPCVDEPYDRARLLAALRVELTALGIHHVSLATAVEPPDSKPSDTLAAVVFAPASCDRTTVEIQIAVRDYGSGRLLERRMPIADIEPAGRPRALAIATAELFEAGSIRPRIDHAWALADVALRPAAARLLTPKPPSEPAVDRAPARRAATSPPRSRNQLKVRAPSLHAALITHVFPTHSTALLGPELGFSTSLGQAAVVRAGAEVTVGQLPRRTDATLAAALGVVGLSLTTAGPTRLDVGPKLSFGYAASDPWSGGPTGEAAGMLLLASNIDVPLSARVHLYSGFEVGYAVDPFLVQDARSSVDFGIVGIALGATIGARFER